MFKILSGMAEAQVLNTIHEMLMATQAYKIARNNDNAIAIILTTWFTDQLKWWWDNFLTEQEIIQILTTVKRDQNNQPINDEHDAVNTLVFAITKYFLGEPVQFQERSSEILQNLICHKMQGFGWYKYVFLSKLYLWKTVKVDIGKKNS